MRKILLLIACYAIGLNLVLAQTKEITGKVVSADDGGAIPGTSVSLKGTTLGTITDMDGMYRLKVPQDAKTLVFTFVGMKTQEVMINNQSIVNVTLTSDNISVDEVVVTALGISREKKALGYAVQEVSGDALTKAKDQNIVNSLSGKIAGVQVTSATGAVGGSSRISIRGNSSFGNNEPLFVIDGIPVSNYSSKVSQWGGVDYGNGASDLDPSNVESITVLKGANAAALYGMLAANGVILVTTKNGAKTKGLGININSSVTFDNAYIIPNYQNKYGQGYNGEEYRYNLAKADNPTKYGSYTYADWAKESFTYVDGLGGGVYDYFDESFGPRLDIGLKLPQFDSPVVNGEYQATDWISHPNNVKDFFETGVTLDNSVSIDGSSDKGTNRLFISRQDITGAVPNTDLTKNTVSLNSSINITKKLSANGAITYTQSKSDNLPGQGYTSNNVMQSIGGWFGRQVNMQSLKDNWNTDNKDGNPYNWNSNYHNNPYWTVYKNTNSQQKDHVYGNFNLNYKLADWISVTGRVGTDWYHIYRKAVIADRSNGVRPGGSFNQSQSYKQEINADLFFNVNKKITDDISLTGTVGANYRDYNYHYTYIQALSLTVPDLFTIGNVSGNPVASQTDTKLRSNSVYASASFDYRKWLFLDLTARNDWSSTLPKSNWSFFYPSATASFIASELLKTDPSVLSFAKLRASWAQVGNATDAYQLAMTYTSLDPYSGTTPFRLPTTLPALNLKPESITSIEVGTELKFLKNRVGLNLTYYDKIAKDQIMDIDISDASGYDKMKINAGEIENKGIELELQGQILKSDKGLNWDIAVNWAKNKNTVNKLYGDLKKYQISSSWGSVTVEAIPGQAFGVIKGVGFKTDDSGNIIVGADGLPKASSTPIEIGNVMPKWTGGISNSFSYRNFNASFLIDMRWGGSVFSVTDWFGAMSGTSEETAQMASRTGVEGKNIREVGLVVGQDVLKDKTVIKEDGSKNDIVVSTQDYYESYWGIPQQGIIDASYVKFRELTFGYSIPKSVLSKIGKIQAANISFVGRNLALLWTHKSNDIGIDPETAFGTTNDGMGIEQYQLPATRSLGFKVSLTF